MKPFNRFAFLLSAALVFASGCSVFPGARVLFNQEEGTVEQQAALTTVEYVMADKTGNTDPAFASVADRIEAAAGNLDIIEIRQDRSADVFEVVMLLLPPNANASQVEQVNAERRAIELTWQGIMGLSEGSDLLRITVLYPAELPTIDNGLSFVGIIGADVEISRSDALAYLAARPTSVQGFLDLMVAGTLSYSQPEQMELYQGSPNHPVFMLAAIAAAAAGQ